jgi:hypothetical protein
MSRDGDLKTALMRMGGNYPRIEQAMLRAFRKYARQESRRDWESIWDWLAVAQHHGLPTRLLDWTYSPFVAMHFATSADLDCDAVIWRVDYCQVHQSLPRPLRHVLAQEEADVFTGEMLSRVASHLGDLSRIGRREFAVFFEPPSLDARIVNQFALFSLMSTPTARFDLWITQKPDGVERIIIPASLKPAVRDMLDQANINERVLFPGLDGLSQYLRRYYQPPTLELMQSDVTEAPFERSDEGV